MRHHAAVLLLRLTTLNKQLFNSYKSINNYILMVLYRFDPLRGNIRWAPQSVKKGQFGVAKSVLLLKKDIGFLNFDLAFSPYSKTTG